MADETAARRYRVGGSKYTVFHWQGQPIAFARQIAETSPAPVGPGPVPIQPLDARHPEEIITPAATSMGQVVVEIYELYGEKVWDRLVSLANNLHDLQAIFEAVANTPDPIRMTKVINPPAGSRVGVHRETYHNCVITNVEDGETIEIGTMEILKRVTVGYTRKTRGDGRRA